ncbi:hypothetical protein [Massilia horti]|uniref:Uncharacterized protein n=1 Tax=Massilia horti TaxID=2562153 RepID=A0A4Y9T8Z6_9BURK|nr:hypothetical protein [Massilia horti]TFW35780.1 hypothetical protein E4O92_01100 [Massilia horti]
MIAYTSGSRRATIEPGTTVFAAEDDGIRGLTYRAGTMTLIVKRDGQGGRFDVEVRYGDGRPGQHCDAPPDLSGMLPRLTEITAKRELTLEQAAAQFPVQAGILQLEDQVTAEPIPPFAVRATADRSAIALVYGDTAIEAAIDPKTFARLEEGCAALGGK